MVQQNATLSDSKQRQTPVETLGAYLCIELQAFSKNFQDDNHCLESSDTTPIKAGKFSVKGH